MTSLKNDRLMRAIYQEPLDRTPVWIMRQAGRYLPEYRQVRAKAGSFKALCQNPALATEVTLQPLRRYPLDAAIIFSDILTVPDAMNLTFHMQEGIGPYFEQPIRTLTDLKLLRPFNPEHLNYVYETIQQVKIGLSNAVPLIGFCGSPWTLAAYMVQGRSVPNFPEIFLLKRESPGLLIGLLQMLASACSQHLTAQIEAGCDAVMIFDTWGGLLSPHDYEIYSLSMIKTIINNLAANDYNKRKVPIILFTKNGTLFIEQLVATGCQVLGVDWQVTLEEVRARTQDKVSLQGNLDPALLLADDETIRQGVYETLKSYGRGNGHIFNLGHGITPDVAPEKLQLLIDAVHELSPPFKQ